MKRNLSETKEQTVNNKQSVITHLHVQTLNVRAAYTLGFKNCLSSQIFAWVYLKSSVKFHNKLMIGFSKMKIVSFMQISNVTQVS